ncbi:proline iminopeptidase [Coleophoma crateriformis]|uniref:Proline iminopeptidase n=1 Tax=Coleophoma crateriformis TaxID=565419 RepID=A0A3D8RWD7_9HELO|nr:proline iminopeptidase [Coleophoma crateriformis]
MRFQVPLDYSNPSSGTLEIFARSASRHESPVVPASDEEASKKSQKPWLLYLQGGPGGACPPPQSMALTNVALDKGYQMLYMDQRGTGLSTPISASTLALRGDAQQQADYLKLFRADSIVQDAEAIRKTLTHDYPPELKKWSIFGQSFGGFCALTYLSKSFQGIREVFMTGGLAPIAIQHADEVYKATYKLVMDRNKSYYSKYPEDVENVQKLAFYIKSKGGIPLPSGGTLTVRYFMTLGKVFGAHGGIDSVHEHVYRMTSDLEQFQFLTRPTLSALENALTFDNGVLYAVLHEAIYCEGTASNWSADRVGKSLKEFQWLSSVPNSPADLSEQPLYWAGEMIFPFMFETSTELAQLRPAAELIAQYSNWPALYDEWQLARNEVPVYAATYFNDMYVDFGLAQLTASKVKGIKQFITNSMYHDALRSRNEEVMHQLFAMRDDSID